MFRLAIIPLLLNFITLYPQESKLDSQFHKERRDEVRKKIARNGKNKYFKLFNEKRISNYIVQKSFGKDFSLL